MADELPASGSGADDLVLRAMLYASGEMSAEDAALFEQLLGENQEARDALCRAVELTQDLNGTTPSPDPAYRSRVRHRLRQRRRQRLGFGGSQGGSFFSHPAFWALFGGAISVFLMVLVSHLITSMTFPPPTTARPTQPQQPSSLADVERKMQIAEQQAADLLDRITTATGPERKELEDKVRRLARELQDLDIQVLKLKERHEALLENLRKAKQ